MFVTALAALPAGAGARAAGHWPQLAL